MAYVSGSSTKPVSFANGFEFRTYVKQALLLRSRRHLPQHFHSRQRIVAQDVYQAVLQRQRRPRLPTPRKQPRTQDAVSGKVLGHRRGLLAAMEIRTGHENRQIKTKKEWQLRHDHRHHRSSDASHRRSLSMAPWQRRGRRVRERASRKIPRWRENDRRKADRIMRGAASQAVSP